MRRPLAALALVTAVTLSGPALGELPKSLEEFKARIAAEATEPEKAARLFFDSVYVAMFRDREAGEAMLTEICRYKDWKRRSPGFAPRMTSSPEIFRSFAAASSPANDYTMDPDAYELAVVSRNDKPYGDKPKGDFVKIFLRSSGADAPRPMILEKNSRGEFKVREMEGLYTGVKAPKSAAGGTKDF